MSPDKPDQLAADSRYLGIFLRKTLHLFEYQRRRGRGRGKGKKGAFMKMLMVAHCETANENDERLIFKNTYLYTDSVVLF